jgi:hypothetical protein
MAGSGTGTETWISIGEIMIEIVTDTGVAMGIDVTDGTNATTNTIL